MDETIPNRTTLLKDHIVDTYIDLCNTSSKLMGQVKGNKAGSKYITFTQFESEMYRIYNLSCVFSLDPVIKKELHDWMDVKRKRNPSDSFMVKSVKLFETFAHELVVRKIIEV